MGHGRAQKDGGVVHIDLETVYVALVQVVDLEQRSVTLCKILCLRGKQV